jgi:hypothetical protein
MSAFCKSRLGFYLFCCIGAPLAAGCTVSHTAGMRYGQPVGVAGHGIQGTSLLASMFRDAGYRVTTARTLGRTVNRSNVVVWFPDRYRPPSKATCDFFETWLSETPGRTLVYVGRDYHADVAYWRRQDDEVAASQNVDPKMTYDVRRWYARARADQQSRDSRRLQSASCKWFRLDRDILPRDAEALSGPWSETAAQAKVPPVVSTHWSTIAEPHEELLVSDNEVLIAKVMRSHWKQNRMILVANGSMLLNLPLVDVANQALADRLIAECGTPGRAVFLTSGVVDPPIASAPRSHYLLRVFTTPPLRCILMHLAVLGMVYCLAVFPIFGRPRNVHGPSRTDFGRHVLALGRLLAKTGDADYAYAARKEYMQKVQGVPMVEMQPNTEADAGNPFRALDQSGQRDSGTSRATTE